jgi:predicted dehydrogenase
MAKTRFGIIGLGNMGSAHARNCKNQGKSLLTCAAVCDIVEEKAKKFGDELGVPYFTDAVEMMESGEVDAVIIATPHYWHPVLTIQAARRKLHVLCEKPLSSSVSDAEAMIAECKKQGVVLGAMLQQRTRPIMRKMKQMIDKGDIGEVFRVQMICSSWFRTQAYYDSGDWRGTWDGEGGGVLINQAPHSLDLFLWMAGGNPKSVQCLLGTREHKIEVEDTANILCDFGDDRVGYIYAATCELPGYEELRVSGDKGTLYTAGDKLMHGKLKTPISDYIYKTQSRMGMGKDQKVTWKEVKVPDKPQGHLEVIKAFARHLQKGSDMIADGAEAIGELQLSNAAYLAGFENRIIEMPPDGAKMDRLIARLEKQRSTGKGGGMRAEAGKELRKLLKAPKAAKKARKAKGVKKAKKKKTKKTTKSKKAAKKKPTRKRSSSTKLPKKASKRTTRTGKRSKKTTKSRK